MCKCVYVCPCAQSATTGEGGDGHREWTADQPSSSRTTKSPHSTEENVWGSHTENTRGFQETNVCDLHIPFRSWTLHLCLLLTWWQYAKRLDDFTQSDDSMAWDISPENRPFLCSETRPQLFLVGRHARPAFLTVQFSVSSLRGHRNNPIGQ